MAFHPKKQMHAKFFKPKKNLGQNFLKNYKVVENIMANADISEKDMIIEVGPGMGILTEELAKSGASVLAIEKDFNLIDKLRKDLGKYKNLKITHQDILLFDPESIDGSYKVIANIPYNITSPIIRKFLESSHKPQEMILMVQKEVAERICAKAGSSERGLLTLIVEFYADAEVLFSVPRTDFYPVPKVDSAVIKLTLNHKVHLRGGSYKVEPELFFKLVKAGFASKRQQIHNSLAATLRWDKEKVAGLLEKSEIDPQLRAEDLTLDAWLNLYQNFIVLYNKEDESN